MTRNELIEQVEDILEAAFVQEDNFTVTANAIISTILAALQNPTEGMCLAALYKSKSYLNRDIWTAMLAASALGEQSE